MKNQPIPKVSRSDVLRVIARDFPNYNSATVIEILDRYGLDIERDRVHLAALKLSSGDLSELSKWIQRACCEDQTSYSDFRDLLMQAEYPRCAQAEEADFSGANMSKVYKADWIQYQNWLNKA